MSRRGRRRMDVRLPGGTVARVDRNLDSAQLARLVEQERQWLAQIEELQERGKALKPTNWQGGFTEEGLEQAREISKRAIHREAQAHEATLSEHDLGRASDGSAPGHGGDGGRAGHDR